MAHEDYKPICLTCYGLKQKDHPDWADYWNAIADRTLSLDDVDACVRFFKDRGYETLPPAKVLCEVCNGTGHKPAEALSDKEPRPQYLSLV